MDGKTVSVLCVFAAMLVVFITLFCASYSFGISKEEYVACENACGPNGGVKVVKINRDCVCNNGAKFDDVVRNGW